MGQRIVALPLGRGVEERRHRGVSGRGRPAGGARGGAGGCVESTVALDWELFLYYVSCFNMWIG
jgi:hypothetical protein